MYRTRSITLTMTMTMTIAAAMALCVGAQAQTMAAGSAIPRLVRFSGTAKDAGGNPVTGVAGITFALYAEQTGGAPLWSETQNVAAGPGGHYTVLLGAAKSEGLPADLFTAEQAHWVGVSVEGQAEQPRILLVSAPYALKAGDAETLGGLPPSAFLLAGLATAGASTAPAAKPQAVPGASPDATCAVITSDGTATANEVAKFTAACTIEPSAIFESGGKVGIGTTAPTATLDVSGNVAATGSISSTAAATLAGVSLPAVETATASAGSNSNSLQMIASAYNSTTAAAIGERFTWQAEPVGNDTGSPGGSLNLLFNTGKKAPVETGLSVASNGQITFAGGQAFPGTGTITGVTAGSGLTGGGTTGTVTVGLTNTCASGQVLEWNGSAWACAGVGTGTITEVTAGTDLTGGGTSGNVTLNLNTSKTDTRYARLGASNSFSGVQSITASSSAEALTVTQTGTGATGDGIHGITSATGGTGVFGQGTIGIQGLANPGGLAGLFRGPTEVNGNGNNTVIGDPGCGSGYAGIGFVNATLAACTNYALTGGFNGDTYINSGGTASIHFRSNNNELATIDNFGNVNVIGQSGGGNLTVAGQATISTANSGGALNVTNTLTSGTAPAVVGTTNSSGANGIKGIISATSGANAGIYGQTASPSGIGVYGIAVAGSSSRSQLVPYAYGVAGDTNQPGGNAVVGTADIGTGGLFVNNSATNDALIAINLADNKSVAFWAGGGPPTFGLCYIDTSGDLLCFGTKSAVVPVDHGERQVALYAVEAPENWFEDMGSGQLSNGAARVGLDAVFAQTVNTGIEYHVFLTPKGDCKGLYVSNESADAFEVHELGGGTSSVAFDYRIVAKRNGYEDVRLGDQTQTFERLQAQSAQRWRAAQKQANTAGRKP